jgi:predicted RNA-binding protein YlqC (UPF0109 family)
MVDETLEHLVKGIVDHPDDVSVRERASKFGKPLEVAVHPDDFGRVIGRNGRTATAIRTVVHAVNGGNKIRIDFLDANGK